MKRVLAMALSVLLVAVSVPTLFSLEAAACDGPAPNYGYSVCMTDDADVLNGNNILNFGARVLGTDTITLEIPIKWEGFDYWDDNLGRYVTGGGPGPEAIDDQVMNNLTLHFSDAETERIFGRVSYEGYDGGRNARIYLAAEAIGLAQGTVWVEFRHFDNRTTSKSMAVPINGRVIDPTINKDIVGLVDRKLTDLPTMLNDHTNDSTKEGVLNEEQVGNLGTVVPGSYLTFYLNTDSFVWEPLIDAMATAVRKSTLDNNKVKVNIKVAKGVKLIESAEIENLDGNAYVVVRFVDDFASVDEKDFDFKIYLSLRGEKNDATMIHVGGTLANDVMYVDEADYAYLGDGTVAAVDVFTKNIELDLGTGVSVFRNLTPDKKYYGVATDERDDDDLDIMAYYPTIRKVLNINAQNISAAGTPVKLSLEKMDLELADGETPLPEVKYYIYDADGKYLAMSDEWLPFRNKYYLSNEMITLDADVVGLGVQGDTLNDLDGEGWQNETFNPPTGQNTGEMAAVTFAFLLLAAGIGLIASAKARSLGKRVCAAVLLFAILIGSAPVSAFARSNSTTDVVDLIVESPFHSAYEGNAANTPEETTPGDEIIIPIMAKGFKDADGVDVVWEEQPDPTLAALGPSVAQLKANGIKPYLMVTAGKDLIRDYEFVRYTPTVSVRAQSALRIRFVEELVSTSELTYRFTIYLNHRGTMFDAQEKFGGMISNPIIEVYNRDYVNLENGDVAHAYISGEDIRVNLGNGVTLYSDMVYDEKYYGVAKLEPNEGQTYILKEYPAIEETYELKTVNLKTHGTPVRFTRFEGSPRYVYNLQGVYLGTTDDLLPYSTRYYLAPEQVQIDVDAEKLRQDIAQEYPPYFPSEAVERFASGLADDVALAPADE